MRPFYTGMDSITCNLRVAHHSEHVQHLKWVCDWTIPTWCASPCQVQSLEIYLELSLASNFVAGLGSTKNCSSSWRFKTCVTLIKTICHKCSEYFYVFDCFCSKVEFHHSLRPLSWGSTGTSTNHQLLWCVEHAQTGDPPGSPFQFGMSYSLAQTGLIFDTPMLKRLCGQRYCLK